MAHTLHSILPSPRRPISYVYPDVHVSQCVNMMIEENIGALVVIDDENLLGIVDERDIVRSLVYKGLSPDSSKVSDILCADVAVLKLSDTVDMAIDVITRTKRRHILVAEDDQLIAIVSIGDILSKLIEDKLQTIEHLKNYIHT